MPSITRTGGTLPDGIRLMSDPRIKLRALTWAYSPSCLSSGCHLQQNGF